MKARFVAPKAIRILTDSCIANLKRVIRSTLLGLIYLKVFRSFVNGRVCFERKPAIVFSKMIFRFLFPLLAEVFQQILKGGAFLNHSFKLWNCSAQFAFFDNAVGEGFRDALQRFADFPDQAGHGNEFLLQGNVRQGEFKRDPASLALKKIQRFIVTEQNADSRKEMSGYSTLAP